MNFHQKLHEAAERNQSWLCIGLDPDLEKIPAHLIEKHGSDAIVYFTQAIVEATKDLVCAYKPNSGFYESLGPMGLEMLKVTRDLIPTDIPMILDCKRGDLGNTARHYAKAAFEVYGADCVTLHALMGYDSLEPFLSYQDRGWLVLVRTSNPSAKEFQDLEVNGKPLYQVIAAQAPVWREKSSNQNMGVVVGATYPEELKQVRKILGEEAVILVPGIGAQGGDLESSLLNGANSSGKNAVISASRSVIFAGSGDDFAEKAKAEAQSLRNQIKSIITSN